MRDLLLELGESGSMQQRVVAGLYRALREGRLREGQRLPASRLWALELGVSRNTIRDATAALVAAGWLESRAGSGLYVKAVPPADTPPAATSAPDAGLALSSWARHLPAATAILEIASPAEADTIDFRPGMVCSDAERLFRAARLSGPHAGAEPLALTAYGDPRGAAPVREQLATYLRRSRGARCEADDIVLTTGTHQSLDLLFRLLLDDGRRHAAEDPGFPAAVRLARLTGATVLPLDIDCEGLRVDTLPAGLTTLYCTPNHQFPLGMALSARRREALLARASADGFVILEDDYDCEFHHGPAPMPCLQSEDRAARVVYLGSTAKLLAPALRIGYIIAPGWLRDALIRAKTVIDRQTSALAQNALLSLFARGDFATHLRRMRIEYGRRRTRLIAAMRGPLSPWLAPYDTTCGLHVAAVVRAGHDAGALIAAARAAGVGLYRASQFSMHGRAADVLVLGFGHTEAALIDAGIERLERAWREQDTGPTAT